MSKSVKKMYFSFLENVQFVLAIIFEKKCFLGDRFFILRPSIYNGRGMVVDN